MQPLVRFQVASLCKGPATRLTDIGFLPCVRPYVRIQLAGRRERLSARLTVIEFLI